ncbi:MAG: glycosyltransferase [Candidatus Sericytochromatia bacterium]
MLDLPGNILIGPVYNHPPMLGKWLGHPQLKLFVTEPQKAGSDYDLVYTPGQDSLDDLLGRLPSDWEPDWILWWDLVFQPLPKGIEKSPCPLVAMVGDWNLGFQTVLDYAEVFDFLIGDQALIPLLRVRGIEHCAALRCYSFLPQLHQPQLGAQKSWDLSFVGNLNYHIHGTRSRYLQRLADLSETYQIRLANGIFGQEYVRLLAQSRIVFNHSVRGEMNMRAYEAPACGALLMMEAENTEVGAVLQDGVSCVLYSQSDFEDKIQHYLKYESERALIAEAGRKIILSQTYSTHFEKIFALLPQVQQRKRPFLKRSRQWQDLARWKQVLTAQTQLGWASLLEELATFESDSGSVLHAQTAFWLDAALKFCRGDQLREMQACLSKARSLWQQLILIWPQHWHGFYLQAWLACLEEETEIALKAFELALSHLGDVSAQELHDWGGFVLPLGFFQPFEVAWQHIFAQTVIPAELEREVRVLLQWQIHFQRGLLLEGQGQNLAAVAAYQAALRSRPDLGLTYLRLGLLQRASDPWAGLQAFRQAAERGVLEPELWLAHAALAIQLGLFDEARQVAKRGRVLLHTSLECDTPQSVLHAWVQVADFCEALEQTQPLKALAAFTGVFDPLFFEWLAKLKPWLPEPFWPMLEKNCALVWHSSVAEPAPSLPPTAGFVWANLGLRVGRSREFDPIEQVLSPQVLPWAFLSKPLLAPVSLDSLGHTNLLLIARGPFQKTISAGLLALQKLCQTNPDLQLFLWFPRPALFSLGELEEAAETEGWSELSNLTLLIEPLSLPDIGGLLLNMHAVLGEYDAEWDYYWAWAHHLGLTVGYWHLSGDVAAELDAVQAWEKKGPLSLDCWWEMAQQQHLAGKQTPQKTETSPHNHLNGLWQFRLKQLQTALLSL